MRVRNEKKILWVIKQINIFGWGILWDNGRILLMLCNTESLISTRNSHITTGELLMELGAYKTGKRWTGKFSRISKNSSVLSWYLEKQKKKSKIKINNVIIESVFQKFEKRIFYSILVMWKVFLFFIHLQKMKIRLATFRDI